MRLDGLYTGPNIHTPTGIRVMGTDDEFRRVGPLPAAQPDITFPGGKIATIPPERATVHQIARHVEIDCQDQHLIDWMAQA